MKKLKELINTVEQEKQIQEYLLGCAGGISMGGRVEVHSSRHYGTIEFSKYFTQQEKNELAALFEMFANRRAEAINPEVEKLKAITELLNN